MRGAAALVLVALLGGCARAPEAPGVRGEKPGYNRRELDDPRPGLFTGSDGVWAVRRSGDAPPPDPPPQSRTQTILLCAPGAECEPTPSSK
jgi:hypothetical protein